MYYVYILTCVYIWIKQQNFKKLKHKDKVPVLLLLLLVIIQSRLCPSWQAQPKLWPPSHCTQDRCCLPGSPWVWSFLFIVAGGWILFRTILKYQESVITSKLCHARNSHCCTQMHTSKSRHCLNPVLNKHCGPFSSFLCGTVSPRCAWKEPPAFICLPPYTIKSESRHLSLTSPWWFSPCLL